MCLGGEKREKKRMYNFEFKSLKPKQATFGCRTMFFVLEMKLKNNVRQVFKGFLTRTLTLPSCATSKHFTYKKIQQQKNMTQCKLVSNPSYTCVTNQDEKVHTCLFSQTKFLIN